MTTKKIVLTAIALACSATAYAQSSVTLYGVLDVNMQHFKADGAGSLTAIGNGSLSTGRWGVRGSEDLGDGLKANFWLEASINGDTGVGRPSNTNNQASGVATASGFDRLSFVGLSGGFGEFRLGRDFTPTHYNSIAFDPFNQVGVGRIGNFTYSSAGNGMLFTTTTTSNSISYWLPPNLGGFYGQAMIALGENPGSAANSDDGNLKSVRLGWRGAKLDIAGAVSRVTYASTAALGDYTHQNLGVTYDFSFFKLFGQYSLAKVELLAGDVKKRTLSIGAHIPVGTAGRIRASYARLDDSSSAALLNPGGTRRSSNDGTQWAVGYVHDMSKRTSLYTTYSRLSNRGGGTHTVGGTLTPVPSGTSTGVELGIKHSF